MKGGNDPVTCRSRARGWWIGACVRAVLQVRSRGDFMGVFGEEKGWGLGEGVWVDVGME